MTVAHKIVLLSVSMFGKYLSFYPDQGGLFKGDV